MVRANLIQVGSIVEGPHGDLVANPNGNNRRVRRRVVGTVLRPSAQHKWFVFFDFDRKEREVTSKSLKLVNSLVGVPLTEINNSNKVSKNEFNSMLETKY